ncbi:N-6 DNA methylase [uncultured Psychrobacter sp.]|uniref:N-6 DNA methylase n=1 Tax=uncultured Psychrobacter sp. TaxID=259303 RepID=UPI002618B1C8|nr:N-6 DNA methylase [uncultured Psychrobacter sp.]
MQNFKTSENTAYQLYDVLRGQNILETNSITALKMTAMYSLFLRNKLPEDIKLDSSTAENRDKWLALLDSLKNSEDEQVQRVFANSKDVEQLPMSLVSKLLQTLLKVPEQEINQLVRELIILHISSQSKMNGYYAHISLYDLVAAILGDVHNKSVYIASPATAPLCTIISEKNGDVSYETINADLIIADVLSLISSDSFDVNYANPLLSPSYTDDKNQLQLFDYGVSFSPMGVRFSSKNAENDKYGRYEVVPKKIETADIFHLIKQCSEKVITTVSEGILFSSMEKPVRQYLIDKGMVSTVISLPSNIWTSTGVKTSMLILDPKGGNDQVRFVDLSESEFVDKTTNRWLVGLTDIEGILAQIESSEETDYALSVDRQSIVDKDYTLYSAAYVLSPEEKKVKSIIAKSETIDLDRLVRFERGLPFNADEGDYTVLEVGAGEIEGIGDIATPTKEVGISESVRAKNEAGFLQPNDIVMILKGSAGKLGIVPESVPTAGDKRWMVNKSGIVIRVTSSKVDPRALYTYLKSDFGTVQISRLIKGATIANISLKELKQMPVIMPSEDEQNEAVACTQKSRETQQTIRKLLDEQQARQRKLWAL